MEMRKLSHLITEKFDEITNVFSEFQNKSTLSCPPGCGKCCFTPDISCSPYELLPLALHLIDTNRAENILEKAIEKQGQRCLFMNIQDEAAGKGRCTEYAHRPFVCRAFGVSARHGKNGQVDYSICGPLKENYSDRLPLQFKEDEIAFIDVWKKQLEAIDPVLSDKQLPINEALVVILEKVLLWNSYSSVE
jgi:Fe-S-cluster containining protein